MHHLLLGLAAASGSRKDEMDYFMIILPLKLALIVYIGYTLLH